MSEPDGAGIPCLWMRGGSSKGGYFLADDLPGDPAARDALLLRILGSPDPRQIDGLGGASPLTSKVAVVRRSNRPGIDVDYLFLQVAVERPMVASGQNCGNILAGVGPFALERGLVAATGDETAVTIHMENSGQTAVARVRTPGGRPCYAGGARIDGVPGGAAAIPIEFRDTQGSACGALLPTGRATDEVDGVAVTLIDNGMPTVVLAAADLGIEGDEDPQDLEADADLRARLEAIRLAAGPMMGLGDVAAATTPKMCLASRARGGGAIATRTFIPHRCHTSIGVLGAVSVATACLTPGAVAARLADTPEPNADGALSISVEHPSGALTVLATRNASGDIVRTEVLRTARKLFDGVVFPGPERIAAA